MASLPESSTFDAGVYQLELTDPVIGGPSGVSNAPLKNLANRTKYLKDHVDALESSRAPLASPAFTGTPTAPTPDGAANNTQLATTAFVKTAVSAIDTSGLAPKASPAFTGAPTAPTPTQGNSSGQLATTAFVNAEIAADAAPISHVGAGAAAHALATQSVAGFMSAADKTALDNVLTGFASSLSASGYQKLPSGLIVQWGKVAGNYVGSTASTTVTFPIAFPNAVYSLVGSGFDDGNPTEGSEMTISTVSKSLSQATLTATRVAGNGGSQPYSIEYIVFGR